MTNSEIDMEAFKKACQILDSAGRAYLDWCKESGKFATVEERKACVRAWATRCFMDATASGGAAAGWSIHEVMKELGIVSDVNGTS